MIITIDGPVATGKSSVARKVAESLGFVFFDTGAMYRSLTYAILKHHIDIYQPEQLKPFLEQFKFEIQHCRGEKLYFYEGEEITQRIRGREVTLAVSEVSANKEVRNKLVDIQRRAAKGINSVFEGRDMGTHVFPDADLKIFLSGRDEVRAKRRYAEFKAKFPEEAKLMTLEMCLEDLNKRDNDDSTREHSPLCQAADAYVIDTSDLTLEQVVNQILTIKDSLRTKQRPSPPSRS